MKYQAKLTTLSQPSECIVIGVYENNEFSKVSMKSILQRKVISVVS
ncbi:Uncharacterised protein [Rodentibacter pneumotropicus]|uniref:Uncharacterized protein n=1 Tax=Rodentibacter pneumotropicus TaxID=758 RepID=A0A3S5ES90_9PAST|nr:Uncharacterised protein [Rodentibacter pneumotropicus]